LREKPWPSSTMPQKRNPISPEHAGDA